MERWFKDFWDLRVRRYLQSPAVRGFAWGGSAFLTMSLIAIWPTLHGAEKHLHEGTIFWLVAFAVAMVSLAVAAGKHARQRSEDRLRHSTQRYRLLFESNPHPMWVFDRDTWKFLEVNDSAIEKYGYTREEFLSMTTKEIRPAEELARFLAALGDPSNDLRDFGMWKHRTKDGTDLDVEISACSLDFGGQRQCLVLAHDVTQKKRLEAELEQARKLEALGRLAGGVAHDFNNLMMIISSYAEMLGHEPLDRLRVARHTERILQATERASSLTQQLLAFSRNQVLAPKIIDLNNVVKDILGLVQRLIGEGIRLSFTGGIDVQPVEIDIGQLTQVVLNLSANARDAMEGSGTLRVSTARFFTMGTNLNGNGRLPAGEYSILKMTDSGSGMTAQVQERIFEPFFTTKERGKGTGLGLSTVYGIVKQSGGYIGVESVVGRGTDFTLYFPVSKAAVESNPQASRMLETGHELVLVAEDEKELRAAIVESLRSLGYRVVHARDGRHAIEVADMMASLDVLVTDVVMPNLPGTEVARYVRKKFPQAKIILMSGYANGSVQAEDLDDKTIFLTKPLSLSTLAKNIRALMLHQAAVAK